MGEVKKGTGAANLGYNETDGNLESSNQNIFPPKSYKSQSWLSRAKCVVKQNLKLSVLLLVALTVIITTVIILALVDTDCSKSNKPSDEAIIPDTKPVRIVTRNEWLAESPKENLTPKSNKSLDEDVLPDAKPVRIVTRNEWLAQSPKENLAPLKLPVHQVIIAHTATEGCNSQTSCVYRVRFIQEQQIAINNYGDIGYNFLIGGDGQVYEGRGWLKVGAFLRGQNSKSLGVAFIGDYRRYEATNGQLEALNFLLENGTNSGYLTADFELYGSNQFQFTESPGAMLYEQLKKHKHWSEIPSNE